MPCAQKTFFINVSDVRGRRLGLGRVRNGRVQFVSRSRKNRPAAICRKLFAFEIFPFPKSDAGGGLTRRSASCSEFEGRCYEANLHRQRFFLLRGHNIRRRPLQLRLSPTQLSDIVRFWTKSHVGMVPIVWRAVSNSIRNWPYKWSPLYVIRVLSFNSRWAVAVGRSCEYGLTVSNRICVKAIRLLVFEYIARCLLVTSRFLWQNH